jgi:hypothetical protein
VRKFNGNATRDDDHGKLDFEGFLSPIVLEAFAEYMHQHRQTADGLRDSDNWQDGISKEAYMKSGFRHFMDWWMEHRGYESREGLIDALCGLMFNVQGYLFEVLRGSEEVESPQETGKESLTAHPDVLHLMGDGPLKFYE